VPPSTTIARSSPEPLAQAVITTSPGFALPPGPTGKISGLGIETICPGSVLSFDSFGPGDCMNAP
jgi:hypothetical protein